MGHQSVWQNFRDGNVKCFVLLSFCVFLCYISSPFLKSFTDQMLVHCSTLPPTPSLHHFFFGGGCPICCIVQNGFLLQETSSRKSQAASLPLREMFSAIYNSSSTPPSISALANFTGLFNRRCLVNSLRNPEKSFSSLIVLPRRLPENVSDQKLKILYTEFDYVIS